MINRSFLEHGLRICFFSICTALLSVNTGTSAAQSLGGFPLRPPDSKSNYDIEGLTEPRFALIIANSDYRNDDTPAENPISDLKNPSNDAALIASSLSKIGFKKANIEIVSDANLTEIKNAVQRHADRLRDAGENAIGIFYYAGHGLSNGNANYLVPIGADIRRPEHVLTQTIPLLDITAPIATAGNRVNLFILDACRNYPFPQDDRFVRVGGLAKTSFGTRAGFLLAFSAKPGMVARDAGIGTPENYSPFAYSLAKRIRENADQPVELMLKFAATDVFDSTNKEQTPWYEGFIPNPIFCLVTCRNYSDLNKKVRELNKPSGPLQIVVNSANPEYPYRTISSALKDVADGGVIFVNHGVYQESISITKSVYIQGDIGEGTGVEVTSPMHRLCIDINPKNANAHVVISNLKLSAKIESGAPCIILRNGALSLRESDILGSGTNSAVRIEGGRATIEKNRISGGTAGIHSNQAHSLSELFVLDNKILQNQTGVTISSGNRSSIFVAGNEIFDNLENGIYGGGYGSLSIVGNTVRNNAGSGLVLDKYSRLAVVRLNEIIQNTGNGISIPFGVNGVIESNTIIGNQSLPIFLAEGLKPKVTNNFID